MPADPWEPGTFGLYLHWPFCEALCPYCDFNTYAGETVDHQAWCQAFLRQLQDYRRETDYRSCTSVYCGGGTPSLMKDWVVATVLAETDRLWGLAADAEITLEANPASSQSERFGKFVRSGINRFSIGVQALNDGDLRQLGRLHDADDGRQAFDAARRCSGSVSIDLIYGRQHQGLDEWQCEIEEACGWGADHLSLYQLTVEPNTAFGRRQRAGRLPGLPCDELAADMQLLTSSLCTAAGYRQYEVSNHARPGHEGRHNLLYWRGGDYIGIGPGAHGRLSLDGQRVATETVLSPAAWLQRVAATGSGESRRDGLDLPEQAEEYLMMSIRLAEGTDMDRYSSLAGHRLDQDRIAGLEREGLVRKKNGRLQATSSGLLLLNRIIRDLLA